MNSVTEINGIFADFLTSLIHTVSAPAETRGNERRRGQPARSRKLKPAILAPTRRVGKREEYIISKLIKNFEVIASNMTF